MLSCAVAKTRGVRSESRHLRAFLFGIAGKLVLKRWRDQHPHDSLEEDSSTCGPVDLLGQERGQMVAWAVQTLPPLQREAIILAEYEDLTLDEIARVTHSELGSVKSCRRSQSMPSGADA